MAFSKLTIFDSQDVELSTVGKALAHPARITIIKILANNGELTCGDLVKRIPLSQSTISQHLKELCLVGLITSREEGTRVYYCINVSSWIRGRFIIQDFFKQNIGSLVEIRK